MKTGRYSYNARQRSIVRQIKKNQSLAEGFDKNYDCAVIKEDDKEVIASSAVMKVRTVQEIMIALCRVCNQIYSQYGNVRMINASFVCSKDSSEEDISRFTEYMSMWCKEQGIVLGAVAASVSSMVNETFLSVHATGFKEENSEKAEVFGYTLCMAGHAGMAGTGLLANSAFDELKKQYTQGFIRQAEKFREEMSIKQIMEKTRGRESILYPIQEGGLLNALWDFADGIHTGFEVDMRKIPIRQETVEISEFYGINPYQLMSDGACLIATKQPEFICAELEHAGICCRIIGQLTKEKARVIRRDDEIRYLDKPAQEELEKIIKIL